MTNVFYYDFIAKMRRSQASCGPRGSHTQPGGEQAGRLCRATANMTASGKRFIIYLSAEIGTEATRKERERESGVGQTQLLCLVAGVVWHVSLSNARVATRVVLLTCQVNAIFMCPERAGHLNPPPEDRFIICPNLKLCHTSVI